MQYKPHIDGLRTVAILPVVIFHAFPALIPGGFIGVDIFFVISGYLICGLINHELTHSKFSFIEFYSRRIRRLFPALFLVLATTLTAGWFILIPGELAQLGKHVAASSAFMQNIILARETGYFDQSSDLKPLLHLWSLGVEEQFYMLWPIIAAVVWRIRRRFSDIALATLILSGASFLTNILITSDAKFFLPHIRFWELMIGGGIAWYQAQDRPQNARWNDIKSLLGLAIITIALFCVHSTPSYPGWQALAPTLGAGLLISAGGKAFVNRTILSSRFAIYIGLISYALYLWHWPLLSFARITHNDSVPVLCAMVALAFVLASLTYHLAEKPVRFRLALSHYRNHTTIILACLMIAVAAAGITIKKLDGVPSRMPENVQALLDFKYDFKADYRLETCFIASNAPKIEFQRDCYDLKHPSIMLFGDSHSAHLYPGLKGIADANHYNLGQLSISGCVPVLPAEGQHDACYDTYAANFALIKQFKPDIVIIGGYWKNISTSGLRLLLQEAKKLKNTRFVVIGPVPLWSAPLPRSIFEYVIKEGATTLPETMSYNRDFVVEPIDKEIRRITAEEGIEYISPLTLLCNDTPTCRVMTNGQPMQWDPEHLTREGSIYLTDRIAEVMGLRPR